MEFPKISTSWLCRPDDVQVLSAPVPYPCLPTAWESFSGWVSALTRPSEKLQAELRADAQNSQSCSWGGMGGQQEEGSELNTKMPFK